MSSNRGHRKALRRGPGLELFRILEGFQSTCCTARACQQGKQAAELLPAFQPDFLVEVQVLALAKDKGSELPACPAGTKNPANDLTILQHVILDVLAVTIRRLEAYTSLTMELSEVKRLSDRAAICYSELLEHDSSFHR